MSKCTISGCASASDAVGDALARHERLVRWVVRQQWLGDLPYPDALQAGRIGLWQALQHYDPGRGTAFSSYAVPAITRAVWRAVAADQRQGRPAPLAPAAVGPEEVEERIDRAAAEAALRRMVGQLPLRLQQVVVTHTGLDGGGPASFAAVGQRLGVSRQRAHQLYGEAIAWLAHPAHSLGLRQAVGRARRADYQQTLRQQRAQARRRRPRRGAAW